MVKKKQENNIPLDSDTQTLASQRDMVYLYQDLLPTMKMKISWRTSSGSPPLSFPPLKPIGLLTIPETLLMPLGWLDSQTLDLLEASLTASISLSGPASGWRGFSWMKSNDDEYEKKPFTGTSRPETSLSHLTIMMPFDRRSKSSRISHNQYIVSQRSKLQSMSSRGRKPHSMTSSTETSSEKLKEPD
ncbi:uncharacterized protein BT62DRAFT_924334 [Guyanagaster necrorhizus]|uniref:Uncharacterized protein n=1 Tax=Guyanagaster necrorhizus TaxID=856835 RepID=A0A9P7VGD0_9AGAR|nr:uncharacterized protein BT62DRAFT_924334 [Guyanagaster necrorhizus MCA 3950]KAG7440050.1 hypothetical protein BT62DRAFT_924334 [Guyanagaster necrorhizus MCA 3950]